MSNSPGSEETTRITIGNVPMSIKKEFQKACLDLDRTMQDVVLELIQEWLEKQKRGKDTTG